MVLHQMVRKLHTAQEDKNLQRGLVHKSLEVVSICIGMICFHIQRTFLIPSGLRCRATSFSGLTTGILAMNLHIMLSDSFGYASSSRRAERFRDISSTMRTRRALYGLFGFVYVLGPWLMRQCK